MSTEKACLDYEEITLDCARDARVGDIPIGHTAPIISILALNPMMAEAHDMCAVLADGTAWRVRGQFPETVLRCHDAEPADPLVVALATATPEEARVVLEALDMWANGEDNQAIHEALSYFDGVAHGTRSVDYGAVPSIMRQRLVSAGILEPRLDGGHRLTAAGAELAQVGRSPETVGRAVRKAESDDGGDEPPVDRKAGLAFYQRLCSVCRPPLRKTTDDDFCLEDMVGEG